MMKLVVLFCFVAVAAGEPSVQLLPYSVGYSTVLPGTTSISQHSSFVDHTPYTVPTYAAPTVYTHLLKKRSVAALPYAATYSYVPTAYSYTHSAPLVTAYSAPLVSSPLVAAPVYSHLIKKRSAPLLPLAYATAPASYSTQSRFDIHTSPLTAVPSYAAAPYAYSSYPTYYSFLKK